MLKYALDYILSEKVIKICVVDHIWTDNFSLSLVHYCYWGSKSLWVYVKVVGGLGFGGKRSLGEQLHNSYEVSQGGGVLKIFGLAELTGTKI